MCLLYTRYARTHTHTDANQITLCTAASLEQSDSNRSLEDAEV